MKFLATPLSTTKTFSTPFLDLQLLSFQLVILVSSDNLRLLQSKNKNEQLMDHILLLHMLPQSTSQGPDILNFIRNITTITILIFQQTSAQNFNGEMKHLTV